MRMRSLIGGAIVATICLAVGTQAAAESKIYWTDNSTDTIQRANLDGSGVEVLVDDLDGPFPIAVDAAGEKMYWIDRSSGLFRNTNVFRRANLDGTEVEDLDVMGLGFPTDIALDLAGGKMYWTDTATDKIQRANLDGTGVEDLVTTGFVSPRGIALDVAGGKMYVVGCLPGGPCNAEIQRANLVDGSGVETLVTFDGNDEVNRIALDVGSGKMYWTFEGFPSKIQRANLDGSEMEELVTLDPSDGPQDIALDLAGGKMYWTFTQFSPPRSSERTSMAAWLKMCLQRAVSRTLPSPLKTSATMDQAAVGCLGGVAGRQILRGT